MKKTTMICAAIALGFLGACKKSNDKPSTNNPAPTVVSKIVSLENYDANPDNAKSATWFSVKDQAVHNMSEITASTDLQKDIIFGYNLNQVNWGIHSPSTYPQPYGQDAWSTKNTTVFKTIAMTQKDFDEMITNDPNSVTVDFINDMFSAGFNPSAVLENVEIGDVFVFEAKNGSVRGLILVEGQDANYQDITLKTWVIK